MEQADPFFRRFIRYSTMTVNRLYSTFADEYEVLNTDRDFMNQADSLHRLISSGKDKISILDLFAGPAYHNAQLNQIKDCHIVSIDSSQQMKEIAISSGRSNQQDYIVSRLPEGLSKIPIDYKFDLVTILRYSLGYLSWSEVGDLFTLLSPLLKPNACLVIELHKISNVVTAFNTSEIREREYISASGRRVSCVWPSSPITWDENDWIATIPLCLTIHENDGTVITESMTSLERIYTSNDIARIARSRGRYVVLPENHLIKSSFRESNVILLKKEDDHV